MASPRTNLLLLMLGSTVAAGPGGASAEGEAPPRWRREAERMVARQVEHRGVSDPRVLEAMRSVPRHRFVPEPLRDEAWDDRPLPIGRGQTISQPYIVARMTELLGAAADDVVLEVGTGSGYQAAVLARIVRHVHSIEIVPELAARSRALLEELGFANVTVVEGDGYLGLPEHAPFAAILVTAAPDHVPQPLLDQLAVGGRMVIPVGDVEQHLRVIERTADGYEERWEDAVRFVPLVRER